MKRGKIEEKKKKKKKQNEKLSRESLGACHAGNPREYYLDQWESILTAYIIETQVLLHFYEQVSPVSLSSVSHPNSLFPRILGLGFIFFLC